MEELIDHILAVVATVVVAAVVAAAAAAVVAAAAAAAVVVVVAAITWRFCRHAAGHPSATKLVCAARHFFLFMFVNCPGVDGVREEGGAGHHRQRVWSDVKESGHGPEDQVQDHQHGGKGAKTFPSIMACVLTWRKRDLDASDMLLQALSGT